VVREDPQRKGLLFTGSERAVWVSFNDGDDWRPLRLNMPATSIRDLVIHGDDLVVATHGRGFWILDDMTPLRQMNAKALTEPVTLFQPQTALRWRWNRNPDTPLPPEEPVGQNPPDGAIVDYYLKSPAAQVAIEILDGAGKLVRTYSSRDIPEPIDPELNVPAWWVRPPALVATSAGMHRFVWDLHYPPPPSKEHDYPISAVIHNTPRLPQGPTVLPGDYTVRLTVDGQVFTQPFAVQLDPRIQTTPDGLRRKFDLSMRVFTMMNAPQGQRERIARRLETLLNILEDSDGAPTTQVAQAVEETEKAFQSPQALKALENEPVAGDDEP
jgi:hypothetical protein